MATRNQIGTGPRGYIQQVLDDRVIAELDRDDFLKAYKPSTEAVRKSVEINRNMHRGFQYSTKRKKQNG